MSNLSVNRASMQAMQDASTTAGRVRVGALLGNAVRRVLQLMPSLLAEAAEDLSSPTDSTRDCDLDQRKESTKEQHRLEPFFVRRVVKYQQLLQENNGRDQIDDLKRAIRTLGSRDLVLQAARERFADPANQYVALWQIREELAAEGASATTLAALDEALDMLLDEQGARIRAGINGALSAEGFSLLAPAMELGVAYREAVCEFTDVGGLFAHIQQEFGGNVDRALDFLYTALANDLAADVPSMGREHLESIMGSFEKLRSLQSARALCARLLQRWADVHKTSCALTDMDLLGKVLGLRGESYVNAAQFARLAREANATGPELKVLFLQELLNTTRSFAPLLFDGATGRMRVLNAVQEAVDTAIGEEDAWLAAQEAGETPPAASGAADGPMAHE